MNIIIHPHYVSRFVIITHVLVSFNKVVNVEDLHQVGFASLFKLARSHIAEIVFKAALKLTHYLGMPAWIKISDNYTGGMAVTT